MVKFSGFALSLWLTIATAAPNYTIPAERCVSPDGFNSCQSQVDSTAQTCQSNANGDQDKITACAQVATEFNLNCVYENCWNIVYSCDVQELASLVAQNFGASSLLYYPAPDDAPGRCSCNLELVEEVVVGLLASLGNCTNSHADNLDGCTCCAQAGAYAGLYEVCPSVDPKIILQTLPGIDTLLGSYSPQFANCGSDLQNLDCVKDLGYPDLSPASLSYLTALPSSTGTASYSDLSGELSSPTAAVITYDPQTGVPLTASAVNAEAGGSGGGSASTTAASGGRAPSSRATTTNAGAAGQMTAAGNGGSAAGAGSGSSSAAAPSSTSGDTSTKAGAVISVILLLAILLLCS
ncbi:hypothetical protein PRZ48_006843 [Zasmidium cellare]|uniref:Uncharacterized protein n=1 Tax=Zasmidium cellare TaxID=395010 RepID=A0ABR0EHQ4_ZASCE|nr:hypothetical protein PRZ48_006843 [Zasmidium cellare]